MQADQPSSHRVPQLTAGNACPQLRQAPLPYASGFLKSSCKAAGPGRTGPASLGPGPEPAWIPGNYFHRFQQPWDDAELPAHH